MASRTTIGLAHCYLGHGGGEVATLWAIQALKDEYDVTLITAGDVDLTELNRFCGTCLREGDFRVRQAPVPAWLRRMRGAQALRSALHQRHCRRLAGEFDVLASGYDPCNFGRRAVQFIADLGWDPQLRGTYFAEDEGRLGSLPGRLTRTAYHTLCRALTQRSGWNTFRGDDILVANSAWMAAVIRTRWPSSRVEVLYPPVAFRSGPLPWEQKEVGFVCLGRIAPEKRVDAVIQILSQVRARGHAVHLHVIGPMDGSPYSTRIERLCRANADWIQVEGMKAGLDKERILTAHRFAVHGWAGEPFGIAVAEMAKAGCLPFVPEVGGAAEIVGCPELCYHDASDAVTKIEAVLKSDALQEELREKVRRSACLFGSDVYTAGVRRIVGLLGASTSARRDREWALAR